MLTQRTKKATIKEIEDISTGWSLPNFIHRPGWSKTTSFFETIRKQFWFNDCRVLCKLLGKPLINMRGYESTPGVWILDCTTGIKWIIWSDGHHKNPWKGTTYEVILPEGTGDAELAYSLECLYNDYIVKSARRK
jgi:hypothetical protein